jgi:hypothetical protein
MALPASIDAISAEWLTDILALSQPGIVVDSVQVVDIVHGACTKVRLSVRSNSNAFPSTLLMKAGFEPHSSHMASMHVNEYHAYHDLVPTLAINAPHCHYAGKGSDGRALVILEDLCLRDVHFLSLQSPIGFDLATRFLSDMARMHARWWGAADLSQRFSWAPNADINHPQHYYDILADADRFDEFVRAPRGAAMPRHLLDRHLVKAAHERMRVWHGPMPKTINHGDMHLGNLYTDADGTPGFLDFQPCIGPWSIDVSYFLIAGLDLVDRRRWQAALLHHYLRSLAAEGVTPPSFDEAWLAYRRDVIWGLLIWMLNGSQFQTESNNTAAATRFAMAMLDLDTMSALEL